MMLQLAVGEVTIPYRIRESDRASRKRIIVTPQTVEVVTPPGAAQAEVIAFVNKKRRWVFDKRQEMVEKLKTFESEGYAYLRSGAKVPYWGRNVRVKLSKALQKNPSISYQGALHITLPSSISDSDMSVYAATELTFWLKDRLKAEAKALMDHYAQALGVRCKSLRVNRLEKMWGSCTKSGVIQLNWHLVTAPKAVLAYVVLHELCHLKHRNHSKEFWRLVATHMPDYKMRASLLEKLNPNFDL